MKKSVQEYVSMCEVCLKAKTEHTKLPGLLYPLPIPTQAWDIISMDFVEGLPQSKNKDTILVVIDKFTKYAHFLPLSHPYTALTVAQTFHNEVYRLHGLPSTIISDRDKVFTSNLWQELFKLSETTLNMSSAYHSQTDGQTERLNQCLETYLRCMTQACPNKWMNWLALAEFWYNTTMHSAHGKTPFEVLYGHQPRHFGISAASLCTTEDLDQWLQDRQAMQLVIQHNLSRAQNRMKAQADKHRQERTFAVGDWVYMKLQPYAQMSIHRRSNHKLSYKFFGSFLVLQRVGKVAYKLQLPESSKTHPVVHVSQLKKAIPPGAQVSFDEELNVLSTLSTLVHAQVLDTCLHKVGNKAV
jgi:hypothetical protein